MIHSPVQAGELKFSLEVFEGPLELLLTLITRQKINIYDIPIAKILEQYLDHIEEMQERNTEIESSFLVMACELLYIKTKMLLPKEELEEDPRAELVQALIEYSKVRAAALFLEERMQNIYRFPPKAKPYRLTRETPEMDAQELADAIASLRIAMREAKEKKKKQDVTEIFSARVVPVEEKVVFLLRRLSKAFELGNAVSLHALLRPAPSRSDVVATFLAALSLTSSGRIKFRHVGNDYILSLVKNDRSKG